MRKRLVCDPERLTEEGNMKREAINPVDWSLQFGFNQGELIEGHSRTLFCSGQVAIDASGAPQHADDIRAQMSMAMDNLESVLEGGGMTLANIVRLTIYTTDIGDAFKNFDAVLSRLDAAGIKPAQTMLGVAALALPQLKVEIEATAAA
jgi:enamine deaminase RidA (YjgF/YER057c/UK114 family)